MMTTEAYLPRQHNVIKKHEDKENLYRFNKASSSSAKDTRPVLGCKRDDRFTSPQKTSATRGRARTPPPPSPVTRLESLEKEAEALLDSICVDDLDGCYASTFDEEEGSDDTDESIGGAVACLQRDLANVDFSYDDELDGSPERLSKNDVVIRRNKLDLCEGCFRVDIGWRIQLLPASLGLKAQEFSSVTIIEEGECEAWEGGEGWWMTQNEKLFKVKLVDVQDKEDGSRVVVRIEFHGDHPFEVEVGNVIIDSEFFSDWGDAQRCSCGVSAGKAELGYDIQIMAKVSRVKIDAVAVASPSTGWSSDSGWSSASPPAKKTAATIPKGEEDGSINSPMFEGIKTQIECDIMKLESGVEAQRSRLASKDVEITNLRHLLKYKEEEVQVLKNHLCQQVETTLLAKEEASEYKYQITALIDRMSQIKDFPDLPPQLVLMTSTSFESEASLIDEEAAANEDDQWQIQLQQQLQFMEEWEGQKHSSNSLRRLLLSGAKRVGKGVRSLRCPRPNGK